MWKKIISARMLREIRPISLPFDICVIAILKPSWWKYVSSSLELLKTWVHEIGFPESSNAFQIPFLTILTIIIRSRRVWYRLMLNMPKLQELQGLIPFGLYHVLTADPIWTLPCLNGWSHLACRRSFAVLQSIWISESHCYQRDFFESGQW